MSRKLFGKMSIVYGLSCAPLFILNFLYKTDKLWVLASKISDMLDVETMVLIAAVIGGIAGLFSICTVTWKVMRAVCIGILVSFIALFLLFNVTVLILIGLILIVFIITVIGDLIIEHLVDLEDWEIDEEDIK